MSRFLRSKTELAVLLRGARARTAIAWTLAACVLAGCGGSGGGSGIGERTVQFDLAYYGEPSGTASFERVEPDRTRVVVELRKRLASGLAEIYASECADLDASIIWGLSPITEGVSESVIDAPIAALTSRKSSLRVHRVGSSEEDWVACGEFGYGVLKDDHQPRSAGVNDHCE